MAQLILNYSIRHLLFLFTLEKYIYFKYHTIYCIAIHYFTTEKQCIAISDNSKYRSLSIPIEDKRNFSVFVVEMKIEYCRIVSLKYLTTFKVLEK